MATLSQSSPGPIPGSIVLASEGELDVTSSGEFDDWLTKAGREHRHLVLDLPAVTFMDTSILAVIVRHWKTLTAAGGTLALAGAHYRKTKTLWVTGLAERLPLYDSAAEATAALQAATPSSGQPTSG